MLEGIEDKPVEEQNEIIRDLDVMGALIKYLDGSEETDDEEIEEVFNHINSPDSGMSLTALGVHNGEDSS